MNLSEEEIRKEIERELWIFRGWTSVQYAVENLPNAVASLLEIFKRGQIEALQELSRKSERHESDGICNSEFYISTDYIHERINELKASLEEGGK